MIFCRAVLALLGHDVLLIRGRRTQCERPFLLQLRPFLLQLLFTRGLSETEKIKSQYLSNDKGQNIKANF